MNILQLRSLTRTLTQRVILKKTPSDHICSVKQAGAFSPHREPCHFRVLQQCSKRFYSEDPRTARKRLLESIYAPSFAGIAPDSFAYKRLSESGMVWEKHFRPGNLEPYIKAQTELKPLLDCVDKRRAKYQNTIEIRAITEKRTTPRMRKPESLIVDHVHQSCSFERNPLLIEHAREIDFRLEKLLKNVLGKEDLTIEAVNNIELPSADALLPGKTPNDVLEIRNHIVVSRIATKLEVAATAGFSSIDEVKKLAAVMLRNTHAEALYTQGWGKRSQLGSFRSTPVMVKSNPLRIFPYHVEVAACMERWLEWRNKTYESNILHPIIFATQLASYFVHVHPFPDGNGRMCRAIMADHLARQGFLPVGLIDMSREEYLRIQSLALVGQPQELCEAVCRTQLEMYRKLEPARDVVNEYQDSLSGTDELLLHNQLYIMNKSDEPQHGRDTVNHGQRSSSVTNQLLLQDQLYRMNKSDDVEPNDSYNGEDNGSVVDAFGSHIEGGSGSDFFDSIG